MNNPEQTQSAGEGALAVQAGRDVHVQQGLSLDEVRQVAVDLFEANFYRLSLVAREEATIRAEFITERFLRKLSEENPEGFVQANEPSFQHALLTVQTEHAKAGDLDLGDLLVDLLVDRSKQKQRDLLQLVLDESLATAPKLTNGQLANLAVVFIIRYTKNTSVVSHGALGGYLDKFVIPFAEALVTSDSSFSHLEFTGCGSTSALVSMSVEDLLLTNYPALFSKGLLSKEIADEGFSEDVARRIFVPCLNDPARLQVGIIRESEIEPVLLSRGVPSADIDRTKAIFLRNIMTSDEIRSKILEIRPAMAVVLEKWSNSGMQQLSLTSVGRAIGHANVKRLVGPFGDLAIWIN